MEQLIRIVTPSAVLLECRNKLAILPGEEGVFGVMPLHEEMIVNLKSGIINIESSNVHHTFYIDGGIAEVKGEIVTVVTEFAVDTSKIEKEKIITKISTLENEMNKGESSYQTEELKTELNKYRKLLSFL